MKEVCRYAGGRRLEYHGSDATLGEPRILLYSAADRAMVDLNAGQIQALMAYAIQCGMFEQEACA